MQGVELYMLYAYFVCDQPLKSVISYQIVKDDMLFLLISLNNRSALNYDIYTPRK